ncbi:SLR1-related LCR [Medicago truncatula]|uniref:SLR1-related LCR n=1 Tax=Medicago truncatula TaxID=3880 RepID=A0A072TUZ2_MEDTR|nr:SLR1-related LCR [Medicago truncatula]
MKNQAVFTFLIVLMTIFSFGFGIYDEASKTEKDCATVIEQTNCVNIQCGNDCAYFFPPETHGSCITPNHCRCFYKSFYCQPDENV